MSRLTEKGKRIRLIYNHLQTPSVEQKIRVYRYNKLAELEDLMEKYNIESVEELEKILKIFFMKGKSE